ncbi:kinetochore protein SPC25 homolog [Andrographis paniculata]|uniref:kinetochore protein SPC25 homolog n=1 Tax=Andrographis paniculata TaxID=175694 RepID=UPI0021E8E179|nr:kinetochore protein SPC25 homolog [Andrographis paniculata]
MEVQNSRECSVLARMAELRLVCEREIPIQQHRIDSLHSLYRKLFDAAKSEARQTIQLQDKLGKVKIELREAEDGMVKALAAKTRKEAKLMEMMDSISAAKARAEQLKRIVEDQRQRKDEYSAALSQQSQALTPWKERCDNNKENRGQTETAISWYNRVLGFCIETGHGVKFIFTNINPENPKEEYSFVVRHENEMYTLLDCDPHLSNTKELVNDLNKTNGLFKFVRTMREKFQDAAAHGYFTHGLAVDQASLTITESAPASSDSTDSMYEYSPSEKGLDRRCSGGISKGCSYYSPKSTSLRQSAYLQGHN